MPPLPKITPVRLLERAAPFDDPDFIFELKYDGFRAVAYIERSTTKLVSRKGITYKRFDDLCTGLAGTVKVKDAIIDGEIVCLDEAGVPRFNWLMHRRHPASFCAFDLVWFNGRDYRHNSLLERKAALRKIIPNHSEWVLYADYVIEHGVELLRTVCERDLEGIVAKQKDAPYAEGVRWVKIKNSRYSQVTGRQEQFQRRQPRSARSPMS